MAQAMQTVLPQRSACVSRSVPRRTRVAVRAAQVKTAEAPTKSASTSAADIYIGKGRFIKDDPKKYPAKEDIGLFAGATGGWAGGEAGLWQLREEFQKVKAAKAAAKAAKPAVPKVSEPGKAPIYIGKAKAGGDPRYIVDDPRKYPGREDIAFIPGATGGFAGGERGLKQFVETGEVVLRSPGEAGGSQFSPISVAVLLVAAGVGGGLALNTVLAAGKGLVVEEVVQVQGAPIDDNTKGLLLMALLLLGAAGTLGGARAAVSSLQQRVRQGAERLLTVTGFWVATLLVTAAVLVN